MLLRIVTILTLLLPTALMAQEDSLTQLYKYYTLLSMYNQKLDEVNDVLRQDNVERANSILLKNSRIYQNLTELDTTSAKPLIAENVITLSTFLSLLKSDTASTQTKQASIQFFQENTAWYESQMQNAALESCPTCFLIRTVKITVLRRINDQRLDTIKCVTVDCKKVLVNNTTTKEVKLISYPCPEYERTLSTGPKYQFIVSYDGKKEMLEHSVDIGSAPTDIQKISLIVPKQ